MNIVNNILQIIYKSLLPIVLVLFSLPLAQAQSLGDIEMTEIKYGAQDGWIEIINTSSSAVTIAGLKIAVDAGAQESITVYDTTPASLASGAIAVISANPSDFQDTYPAYKGPIYTTPTLVLPEQNGTSVEIFAANGTTLLHTLTYNTNALTQEGGITLHVGLDAEIVAAPATPGNLAVNPIAAGLNVPAPAIAVASSVSGGIESGGLVFLNTGDTITLHIFHSEHIPDDLTAKIVINEIQRDVVEENTDSTVSKTFTYTVAANDPSGHINYALSGSGISDTTGAVTEKGQQAVIDGDVPTASFSNTLFENNSSRMKVEVTVEDTAPSKEMRYKLHTAACNTKEQYTAASGSEQTVPIEKGTVDSGSKYIANVVLYGSEHNGKYVCVHITDLVGKEVYTASPQISGITDLTIEITEISYTSSEGGEWIEIINSGSTAMTVTNIIIVDGDTPKSITHVSGSERINTGDVAVIVNANNLDEFISEYSYSGPLFKASIALTDGGDTVGLRLDGDDLDVVTYSSSDGARRNSGKTLHILSDGRILEGVPSPGTAKVASERTVEPDSGELPAEIVQVNEDRPVVSVRSFAENNVNNGQNIFFTNKDTVSFRVRIEDNDTNYTSANIDRYVTVLMSATNSSTARYEQGSVNYSAGVATITYTVHFSAANSAPQDNRVKLSFMVTDANGTESSKQSVVTVVRNSNSPSLGNATSASVLGFSTDAANIIVPITVSDIVYGDWLRIIYNPTCGDGLLSFIARNGGHGIPYILEAGTYAGCTVEVADSAGNRTLALEIPQIIIGS